MFFLHTIQITINITHCQITKGREDGASTKTNKCQMSNNIITFRLIFHHVNVFLEFYTHTYETIQQREIIW